MPGAWREARVRPGALLGSAALLVACALLTTPVGADAMIRSAASPVVTLSLDTTAGQVPISPLIYGINDDKSVDPNFNAVVAETRPGLIRLGGNRWTAYNWENNDSNAGSDYQYENDDYLSASTTPGAAVLPTVQAAVAAGAAALVTVPIAGYVSADRNPPGPVQNSGSNYLSTRFDVDQPTDPAPLSTTPNLGDGVVYQNQFAYWLKQAAPGANVMFSLDNEPDLWASTHAEIHPAAATYAEVVAKDLSYAAALKKVWPTAAVTGPVSYGWYGYETLQGAPDSGTDGNFLDWYLAKVKAADTTAHARLINDLDLHWYPEATGLDGTNSVRITGTDVSPGVVAAREQAPRSLWDPTYVESSWITQSLGNKAIELIPRLRAQIAANDPGMRLDFSEWNYGGGQSISGGIATADVLGIFGRRQVNAAALWPLNSNEQFTYGAFAVFRNYDGHGATFGDTEVQAHTTAPATTSVYASIDKSAPNHVVIVAINKSLTATPTKVVMSGSTAGHAAVYTLTSASPLPQPAPGLTATATTSSGATYSYTMPAQSVSVLVPTP